MAKANKNVVSAAVESALPEVPEYKDYNGAQTVETELPGWLAGSKEDAVKESSVSIEKAQAFVDSLGLNEDVDNQAKFDKTLSIKAYKCAMKAYQERAPEYISAFLAISKVKFSQDDNTRIRAYFRFAGFSISGTSAVLLCPSKQCEASQVLKTVTVRTLRIKAAPKKIEAAESVYTPCLKALEKCTEAAKKAADKTGTVDAKLQEGGADLHKAKTAEWTFANRVQKAAAFMALIERNGGNLDAVLNMLEGMSKDKAAK